MDPCTLDLDYQYSGRLNTTYSGLAKGYFLSLEKLSEQRSLSFYRLFAYAGLSASYFSLNDRFQTRLDAAQCPDKDVRTGCASYFMFKSPKRMQAPVFGVPSCRLQLH